MLRLSDKELQLFMDLLGGGEYDRTLHKCGMSRYDAANLIVRLSNELKQREESRKEYEEQQQFILSKKEEERHTYIASTYKTRKERNKKENGKPKK